MFLGIMKFESLVSFDLGTRGSPGPSLFVVRIRLPFSGWACRVVNGFFVQSICGGCRLRRRVVKARVSLRNRCPILDVKEVLGFSSLLDPDCVWPRSGFSLWKARCFSSNIPSEEEILTGTVISPVSEFLLLCRMWTALKPVN